MTKMKPKDKLAKRNVFLDTSVILERGMNFLSRTAKAANLYVTDIVLQELDGKKNAEGKVGFNAREFYRQFNTAKVEELHELPDGQKLDRRDILQQMTLPDGLVLHTIHRAPYKTRDINDSKIIEVSKDYKGTLSTIDMAQSVRAKSVGCDTWVVKMGGGSKGDRNTREYSHALLGFSLLAAGFYQIEYLDGFGLIGTIYSSVGFLMMLEGLIKYDRSAWRSLNTRNDSDRSDWESSIMDSSSDESPYTDPSYMGASWSYYNND